MTICPENISIISSVYRSDRYLSGFLKNISNQTCFENCQHLIALVDGSSYENQEIDHYVEKYHNVQVLRFDQKIGIYHAWNACLEAAKGRYITNANVDDIKTPWALETLAKNLDENPDIDIVYGRYIVLEEYINDICELYSTNSKQAANNDEDGILFRLQLCPWECSIH